MNIDVSTGVFTINGKFLMLALDHRETFRKLLNPNDPKSVDKNEIINYKKEILMSLKNRASGFLIDDEYGLEAYKLLMIIDTKPYLLAIENSGYLEQNGGRLTVVEKTANELKDKGALGVKLLIYFDKDNMTAGSQIRTAKAVLQDSHNNDLPLFLEIVTYGPQRKNKVSSNVEYLLSNDIIPDVFKIEYPGSADECKKITKILRETPWILLTKGTDYTEFCDQLRVSSQNGCSGFLAGRSLWQDLLNIKDPHEKDRFLKETLPSRFDEITKIAKS